MREFSTILIADDEQGIRDVFSSFLTGPDYRLLFAENGRDALEMAFANNPDLVLLDVIMPEMNGFEACRRLREDPRTKEIPILIVTALDDHRSRLEGIEAGADDYISKPFDFEELAARVRSITRLNRYRTLLAERMKFERLFDLSPDGVIIVDSKRTILLSNPAMRRIIGLPDGQDIAAERFDALVAPDLRSALKDQLRDAAESRRLLVETVLLKHDGTRFPVEISAGDVLYEGQPALYCIIRDITERKRIEEHLHRSEQRYRDLIEKIQDLVYVTDGRGDVLFLNDAMERSFGYTKEEIIGRPFMDFVAPEDLALAKSLFRQQLTGNYIGPFELSFINRDGSRITLELHERLVWHDRTVTEVHGIGRDITERRRIQQQLRKSEERFSNLFKTSRDLIFICDDRDRFVDINPVGQALLNYSREEVLSLSFADICAQPADPGRLKAAMDKTGFVEDFDLPVRGKDHMTIDCLLTATRTTDPSENGGGFQGIIKDITEKKRFVDLTLDGIKDGVFTVDRQWTIRYVNSGAEEIMRIKRQDSIGKSFFEVFRPGRHEDREALARIMESNRQIIDKKIVLTGARGARIPVVISGAPLSDRSGSVTGAVMILRDLSAIEALKKEIESSYTFEDIISKNHRILEIFSSLPDISESGSTVLLEGPSGTGKELFARAIHNLSPRKAGPFIAINCSAIPETLLESELFGYVKGAFTNALTDKPGRFALAEGGTLFLDEIGELPKSLQVKLLRVLEEREYEPLGAVATVRTDARIIASTNRSIAQEIAAGTFREDLFYRLNVMKIRLPRLRERREDIPLLIDHFLRKFSGSMGKNIFSVSDEVLAFLMGYDFPGNVRELENIIEHACVLCRRDVIDMEHLPKELTDGVRTPEPITALKDRVMDSEKELIKAILARYNGDRAKAALALNIGRTSLWRKMKKYRLL